MTTFRQSLWDARYVLMVAGAVLAFKAVFILLSSIKGLSLTSWIIDDAFIEMAVSQNIALGYGFTYDFVHPTTGSPFLWTYLMSLCFMLFNQALAVKASLIFSGFFASLATIVVYVFTLHITRHKTAAWLAFLMATFSGNAFLEAVNGMDTASFTFFTVLAFALYAGVWTERLTPMKRGLVTGVAVALALMTRGDGIFVAGTIGLMQLIQIARASDRKSAIRLLIGFMATAFIGWAVITIWQISVTGSPFLANQIGRREISLAWHQFSYENFELLRYLRIVIWNTFELEQLFTVATGSTLLCLVALMYGYVRKETREAAIITTIYLVSFCGALVAYQWYFADFHGLRYINPAAHLFFMFVAWMFVQLFTGKKAWIPLGIGTLAIVILSLYAFYDLSNKMPWGHRMSILARPSAEDIADLWEPIEWIKTNVPEGSVLGIRDHGRIALFTGVPIQDIAGNIDPNIPALLKEPDAGAKLKQYFRDRNVDYLFLLREGKRQDKIYVTIYDNFELEMIPEASRLDSILYRIAWEKMDL